MISFSCNLQNLSNVMFVCLCKSVTDHQIRAAVDDGVRSFEDMQTRLDVGSVCGSCTCEVKQIMQRRLAKEVDAVSHLPIQESLTPLQRTAAV